MYAKPLPAPPLRDYQKEGVNWIYQGFRKHRGLLLADDAGIGKTVQALTAAEAIGARRVLVICPAGARRVWRMEIEKWMPAWKGRTLVVEPGTPNYIVAGRLADTHPLVLIVGYDDLSNPSGERAQELKSTVQWDLLVLDEAHFLKNASNRTLAIYGKGGSDTGIQGHVKRVLLLTGTPTPNHAGELYQHCRAFWPKVAGAKTQAMFEEAYTRYKTGKFGRQVVGSKNQHVLRRALAQVILRRRKIEVLTELPDLQVRDMPLTFVPADPDDWLGYEVFPAFQRLSRQLRDATDDEILQALRSSDTHIALLRHRIGIAKVASTIEWVHERLQSVDKIIVFAWHVDVIQALASKLEAYRPAVITGKTTGLTRELTVKRFQNEAGTRVFLGQIQACGTAITLTAAAEVAIMEPSWVPSDNVQAIARAHRLGQRDSVLASFLYLPGTLDEKIMTVFRRKAAEIGQLQGDFDRERKLFA